MALSSLASMSQFQNKFYKIFNGENNQGMLIISFIEKLLNLSKEAEKICRGIVVFRFLTEFHFSDHLHSFTILSTKCSDRFHTKFIYKTSD